MRLLIIAPNAMLVSLLTKVLGDEEDIDIVGAITNHEEAHRYGEQVDIVAFHADVAGPDLFDAIRDLRQLLPNTKVVLLHAPDLQDLILGAIEVGAVGYVHSHHSVAQMLTTLRTVHRHGASIDPEFTSVLVERMAQLSQQVRDHADIQFNQDAELTERQTEVLRLVHQGLSNEEISEQLYISVGTVKNHVHNILKTLEVDNREQAAYWYAWRQGEGAVAEHTNGTSASHSGNPSSGQRSPAERASVRETIGRMLERFCQQLNWSIGHVFLLDSVTGELVPSEIWYLDDPERYQEFRQETARRRFKARQDVIGNILFSPEPVWVADVRSYPGYSRAQSAHQAGIRSGLVLPLYDGELIGVMEFYATVQSQPDPHVVAELLISSRDLSEHMEEEPQYGGPRKDE